MAYGRRTQACRAEDNKKQGRDASGRAEVSQRMEVHEYPIPQHLRLPDWDKEEAKENRAAYPVEIMKQIMESAEYPYNVLWWLIFETHIRRGEACGLDVRHINFGNSTILVRRNRVLNVVKNTKSKRGRLFSISQELLELLRPIVKDRNACV